MIKKMKYETPEIEITSFELEEELWECRESRDIIPDEQSTQTQVIQTLFQMLNSSMKGV